jgi:hypothetical protein
MSELNSTLSDAETPSEQLDSTQTSASAQPSYVKLAMRNMVRKGRTSLFHFALTAIGLLAALIGLSYLTR